MAIRKIFEETIQKAVRIVSGGQLEGLEGQHSNNNNGDSSNNNNNNSELNELLRIPTDKRLWAVQSALEQGYSVDEVNLFFCVCE